MATLCNVTPLEDNLNQMWQVHTYYNTIEQKQPKKVNGNFRELLFLLVQPSLANEGYNLSYSVLCMSEWLAGLTGPGLRLSIPLSIGRRQDGQQTVLN